MLLLYRLLRGKKYRQARRKAFDPANPPPPMRWRPKLRIYGLITGLLGGLGTVILVAQYGISPVTNRALSIRGVLGALASGLVLPSLVFALVVWRFNRKLRKLGHLPGGGGPKVPSPAAAAVVALVVVGVGFGLATAVAPAGAEVNGRCVAAFAGQDAEGRTVSAGDAIEVPEDSSVSYFMAAPDELETWQFWLQYGPIRRDIAIGDKDEPRPFDLGLGLGESEDDFLVDFQSRLGAPIVEGNSVTGAVATDEYAWLGGGLYEVHGQVTTVGGQRCDGVILIDVAGDPLSTALGLAAAGAVAIGVAGAAAVTVGGLRDGGEALDPLDELPEWRQQELEDQARFRGETMDAAAADWEERRVGFDAERAAADAALLAEIRAGRTAMERAETYLERRQAALDRLRSGEASQAELDDWGEYWGTVRDDAFDGMVRDVDSLPAFVQEAGAATRQQLGEAWEAATDPENWRVVAEAAAETAYDAAGLASGGTFGDAADDIGTSFNDATEIGTAVVEAAANDPWGFVRSVTPLQAMSDAVDGSKPLGERLVAVGTATIDIGLTLAGGGLVGAADDAVDAARLADAVDDARDIARVADAADAAHDAGRAVDGADEAIEAARDARRAAWEQARRDGKAGVDDFVRSMGDDALDSKEAALRVQGSRQGIAEIKGMPDDVKSAFNGQMRQIYDETDLRVRTDPRVLDEARRSHGVDFGDLRLDPTESQRMGRQVFVDDAGNQLHLFEPTNSKPGVNVGADRDFTVYVKPADSDVVRSMDRRVVGDSYRDAFYEAAGGDEMAARLGADGPDDLLVRMDQAITDDLDPEAYRNVQVVLGQPYGEIGDATQVGKTVTYKADHLFDRAESMTDLAAAEEWMGDGMRQLTKQFDNQVSPRFDALGKQVDYLKASGDLPADFALSPIDPKLEQAVDIMRQTQTGVSPVDVEAQLRAIGMTPRDVSAQVGEYVETMERLRPGPVVDLQRRMATDGGLLAAVMRP